MTKAVRVPQKPKQFQSRKYTETPEWKAHSPKIQVKRPKHPNRIYDDV